MDFVRDTVATDDRLLNTVNSEFVRVQRQAP